MTGKKKSTKAKEEREENLVGITVKVPEPSRRHWTSQAKAKGTTIRDTVIECLTAKFGKPPKT